MRKQEIERTLRKEQAARLEAEKKIALEIRERRALEAKLREFERMGISSATSTARSGAPEIVTGRSARSAVLSARDSVGGYDSARSNASMSSVRSAAIDASVETRRKARAMLDSLRDAHE